MIVLAMMLGLAAEPAPVDARSCAIRYRSLETMFSYDFNNPASVQRSKAYGARAVEVLVKARLMSAGGALPADVATGGQTYTKDWSQGRISDQQVATEVAACDRAHGYAS